MLSWEAKRLTAGCKNLNARASFQNLRGKLRHGVEQVLAVVKYEQHGFRLDALDHCFDNGPNNIVSKPEYYGCRLWRQCGIDNGSKLDQPNSVLKIIQFLCGQLERETRFAASSRSRKRQEATRGKKRLEFR